MEQPFYGRTGLLASGREGVPVHRARLATKTAAQVKWQPSLLTAPQRLLNHFTEGGNVDESLVALLRLGSIASLMQRGLALDQTQMADLHRRLLQWHHAAAGPRPARRQPPPHLSWYLPDYKVIIVKEGASIGSLGDVSRRSVTLLGKDRTLCDVALDHPSCSSQHAVLEARFALSAPVEEDVIAELTEELSRCGVTSALEATSGSPSLPPPPLLQQRRVALLQDEEQLPVLFQWLWKRLLAMQREEWIAMNRDEEDAGGEQAPNHDGLCDNDARGATTFWTLELTLTDLGSTNGTIVNGTRLAPYTPTPLIEGDVVGFGASSRQYVVMRSSSSAAA